MALRWYVIHAYSGYEQQVMRTLKERIKRYDMEDKFGDILVPTQEREKIFSGLRAGADGDGR